MTVGTPAVVVAARLPGERGQDAAADDKYPVMLAGGGFLGTDDADAGEQGLQQVALGCRRRRGGVALDRAALEPPLTCPIAKLEYVVSELTRGNAA